MFLWSLRTPAKVKLFFWRAIKNYLPTFANLAARKIMDFLLYAKCKVASDDTFHSLVCCKYARKAWKETPFAALMSKDRMMDFMSFGRFMVDYLTNS